MRILPLLLPATGKAVAVVITFALLLTTASDACPFLQSILIFRLFNQAYILIDHSVWGGAVRSRRSTFI